ncbi:hypothetical protein COB57_01520 [Candidatus Peregrinibacteria bacterium]|nr:MAG: hypothetical protein COB57_01520 [Candidatus Peregrinibacteria bacterium]
MNNKKLLIFDLDGVLFDSHDASFFTWTKIFSDMNFSFDFSIDVFNDIIRNKSLSGFLQEKNISASQHKEIDRRWMKESQESFRERAKWFDHMEVFLQEASHKYKIAFATNNIFKIYQSRIDALNVSYAFADHITHFDNKKPKPNMILDLLRKEEIEKNDAVFIGDAVTDGQAAASAGIDFCWAKYGAINHSFPQNVPVKNILETTLCYQKMFL